MLGKRLHITYVFVESKTVKKNMSITHTDIDMKLNTTLIEMDYEDYIDDGFTHSESIRLVAKEWGMTPEEVNNVVQPFLARMNDIDHTGDLGDII